MQKSIEQIEQQALATPGVRQDQIYKSLGLYAEERQNYVQAKAYFQKAALIAPTTEAHSEAKEHLNRIADKQQARQQMVYAYQG